MIRPPKGPVTVYLRSQPFRPICGTVTHVGPKAFRIRTLQGVRQYRCADVGAWTKEMT